MNHFSEALQQGAAYSQALAEPAVVRMPNLLRQVRHNVGDLAQLCGFTAANVPRHLSFGAQNGLAVRKSRGTSVYHCIADANGMR